MRRSNDEVLKMMTHTWEGHCRRILGHEDAQMRVHTCVFLPDNMLYTNLCSFHFPSSQIIRNLLKNNRYDNTLKFLD